mgnify:CR=1 FL=1
MMKKQYLVLAGVLVIALSAAGCGGNDKNNEGVVQEQATPTPEPTVTESVDLVDMEVTEEKNVIGEKTASAHKVTIINRTGSEVGAVYIRSVSPLRKRGSTSAFSWIFPWRPSARSL